MAGVFSVLRFGARVLGHKTALGTSVLKPASHSVAPTITNNVGVICRHMGGAGGPRKMQVLPSRHEIRVFKDQLHFYLLLGAIPLGGVMLYTNVFIGQAQLTDIPEGYEPKRWEYYKHPIQRFFARYVYNPPEKTYEIALHHMVLEQEKKDWHLLERKVMDMMKERGDYKDWYYVGMEDRGRMMGKEYMEDVDESWSMPERMKGTPPK